MNGTPYSLRRHLLALISAPIILAGIIIGGLTMAFVYHEIGEVYDEQLVQTAKLLLQLTKHELEEQDNIVTFGAEKPDLSSSYEKKISFRIWKNNRLVTQSVSAGVFARRPSPPGFTVQDVDGDGTFWRIFVYADKESHVTVEVAENNELRTRLIFQILGGFIIPALIFAPLILFFVWWGTTRSMNPMLTLAQQINRRGTHDLMPLGTEGIPEEILPFIIALNRLFLRIEETFRREREFTDNAAHELRTPLAAIKTQIQVLMKNESSGGNYREGLTDILSAVDRAARMVEQLLAFARLQSDDEAIETVDISSLAEETLRDISPLPLGRRQDLGASIQPGVELQARRAALAIMLRNLVDNAVKYTPEGGHIAVNIAQSEKGIVLEVSDDGPGIPAAYHAKIFERFFRIDKSQSSGSGLGLAMVRWIADMHHAAIELEDREPHGLTVRIIFPTSM